MNISCCLPFRFVNVLDYSKDTSQYMIDYSSFNKVYRVETPRKSAKQLEEDSDSSTPERSPTVVTMLPSPSSSGLPSPTRAMFFNHVIPYTQSQAALTPPFASERPVPTRGLVSNRLKSNLIPNHNPAVESGSHQRVVSHLSLPCLQHAKVIPDPQEKLSGSANIKIGGP